MPVTKLTIDTSVFASAFAGNEAHSAVSLALLEGLTTSGVFVIEPTFVLVEIASAIARRWQDSALAVRRVAEVKSVPSIAWVVLDQELTEAAVDVALRFRLRGADCIYPAVAMQYGCTLVSLDSEHLIRLSPIIPTLNPTEALAQLNAGLSVD